MSYKKPRSGSVGPKLMTTKQALEDPLLVPQPPEGLPRAAQKEWIKAQVALANLHLTPGHSGLDKQALKQGNLAVKAPAKVLLEPKANPKANGWGWWRVLKGFVRAIWPKAGGTLMLVFLIASLFSGKDGPVQQISRVLGSFAVLSEATAMTGSAVINATGQMANSVSGLALAAVWQSLRLSESAWHGVDLLNVVASRCDGHVAVDGAIVLAYWLDSKVVQNLANIMQQTFFMRFNLTRFQRQ